MKFKQISRDMQGSRNLLLDENGDIWVGRLVIEGQPWVGKTYEYKMVVCQVEIVEEEDEPPLETKGGGHG